MDTLKQINKSIIVSILTSHCGEIIDLGLIMNMMVEMEFGEDKKKLGMVTE